MRLGYRAADSKIGQELTVGFKALMLGTRAYYDLFQIDSATNLVAWGGSYKSELEALSRDAERASQMEGTSLVDVARTVEAAVGRK
jgi:hypothetical protein